MRRTTADRLIFFSVLALPFTFPSSGFAQATQACKLACEKIKLEQDTASALGARYISPKDIVANKDILSIQTRRDLTGGLPAVDDELYLVNDTTHKELWRSKSSSQFPQYGGQAEAKFTLRAHEVAPELQLAPGLNVLQLWYADTQPPDAHFFADLCGFAFFGRDDACISYREGKTFGSGIVHNGIRVVVRETKVWVSKVTIPKTCKCP